jgi:hypothetical protein
MKRRQKKNKIKFSLSQKIIRNKNEVKRRIKVFEYINKIQKKVLKILPEGKQEQ